MLDRYCRQILSELQHTVSNDHETPHARYLAAYRLIEDRDRKLGQMFNDIKRSNAMLTILSLRNHGLITDEEFAGFSDEVKALALFLRHS